MQSAFRFMRFYILILSSAAFCYSAEPVGEYSWQPVQLNMRLRNGDYQTRTHDEYSCKDRCVQNPVCIGADWHTPTTTCFLLYDSSASPYSENGYHHWRITRNRPTLKTSQVTLIRTTPLGSATTTVNNADVYTTKQKLYTEKGHTKQDFSNGPFYSWKPVQYNARMKTGHYRAAIKNETVCKAECLKTTSCAGVFWFDPDRACNFHTDCSTTQETETDFRLWIIQKYGLTPISDTCQNLINREASATHTDKLSVLCEPRDDLTRAVNALAVLLSASTVIIIGLLFNTCRLNRRMRKKEFMVAEEQQYQQVVEQRYESNNNCPNQTAGYVAMDGTRTPRPSDNENLYDDIDEARRL